MYQAIYQAFQNLSKGDRAELKRCNLQKLRDSPAYFRVLKYSGMKDNQQTVRILFLLIATDIDQDEKGDTVATALLKAGVKEAQIIQITRSGDNALEYLKRQIIRCKHIQLSSIGKLAQYWGENTRRQLLKEFILATQD